VILKIAIWIIVVIVFALLTEIAQSFLQDGILQDAPETIVVKVLFIAGAIVVGSLGGIAILDNLRASARDSLSQSGTKGSDSNENSTS
jgi:hypothetical protein